MKVEAYRCDRCGAIRQYDGIVGIIAIEDMFDRLSSYPTDTKPERCKVHVCTECYNKEVVEKARVIDRGKDNRGYELKVKELAFNLRQTCVFNVRDKRKLVSL
jgi:hypothetical protein